MIEFILILLAINVLIIDYVIYKYIKTQKEMISSIGFDIFKGN